MDAAPEITRDALTALTGRMLNAETRTTPPPLGEEGDWLFGGSAGFTRPDEHGWMAPLPSAHVWTPKALVFWKMAIRTGAHVSEEQRRDPCHSLARWPAIEAAIDRLREAESGSDGAGEEATAPPEALVRVQPIFDPKACRLLQHRC